MADVTITVDRDTLLKALAFGAGDEKHRAAQAVWAQVPLSVEAQALVEVLVCGNPFAERIVTKLAENGWKLAAIGSEDDMDRHYYHTGCNGC